VRLAPPLVITEDEVDQVIEAFRAAVQGVGDLLEPPGARTREPYPDIDKTAITPLPS
jgi:hypothetical protein